MVDNNDYAGKDDTDLRDRQERDRLVRRARDTDRREPRRRPRERGGRLSDNVQSADRVANRVANDVNALVRAWSASNAEAFKGIVTIVGNIALDLVGDARPRRTAAYDDDHRDDYRGDDADRDTRVRRYADDDDDDDDDRPVARRGRDRDAVGDVGGDFADVTHSLSDAFAEAASVTARSSRRFQDEFDAALDDTAAFDDDIGRRDTNPRQAKRLRQRRSRQPDEPRDQRDAQDAVGEAGARVGAAVDDLAGRER